jgi:hypothetical protein
MDYKLKSNRALLQHDIDNNFEKVHVFHNKGFRSAIYVLGDSGQKTRLVNYKASRFNQEIIDVALQRLKSWFLCVCSSFNIKMNMGI